METPAIRRPGGAALGGAGTGRGPEAPRTRGRVRGGRGGQGGPRGADPAAIRAGRGSTPICEAKGLMSLSCIPQLDWRDMSPRPARNLDQQRLKRDSLYDAAVGRRHDRSREARHGAAATRSRVKPGRQRRRNREARACAAGAARINWVRVFMRASTRSARRHCPRCND